MGYTCMQWDTYPFGREAIVRTVWEDCVVRSKEGFREIPIIALFGPRGSGKTMVLSHLVDLCRDQAAQPFSPVLDLSGPLPHIYTWQVFAWFTEQLTGRAWPQFGRLSFRCFTLGRIVLERTEEAGHALSVTEIRALLRDAATLTDVVGAIGEIVEKLPKLFGIGPWIRFLVAIGVRVMSSERVVDRLLRSSLAFYATALSNRAAGPYPALAALSALQHAGDDASLHEVGRALAEAFLADLDDCYARRFCPRNTLVLLDNVDDQAGLGQRFLTTLHDAKTNRLATREALAVVVTSGRIDPAAQLLRAAGIYPIPLHGWLRPDTTASHEDWLASRPNGRFWLYPVRLTDLDPSTVERLAARLFPGGRALAGYAHSLTTGHPWGVRHVLVAITSVDIPSHGDRRLDEAVLRGVLDRRLPGHDDALDAVARDLLIPDVPQANRLPACAAALDIISAQQAGLAGRVTLRDELTKRFWLVPGSIGGDPDAGLHSWLRRLLLRSLAEDEAAWKAVFGKLRFHCEPDTVTAAYYELALEQFTTVADQLHRRFRTIERGRTTADAWIAEFNLITSAPGRYSTDSAAARHSQLLSTAQREWDDTGDPQDRQVRATILNVMICRWIWSDPPNDPRLTLNPILQACFRDLALSCHQAELRFIQEADFYGLGGRPYPPHQRHDNGPFRIDRSQP